MKRKKMELKMKTKNVMMGKEAVVRTGSADETTGTTLEINLAAGKRSGEKKTLIG
jgi:hypothetical protein